MTASENTENVLVFCKVGVHQEKDGTMVLCRKELNKPELRKDDFINRDYKADP